METKALPIEFVDFKFNDDQWTVGGYASVFNSVDKSGDTIVPGAFAESIAQAMPIMRFEHLRFATPGKWTKAVEDDYGLRVEGELTKGNRWAEDARASLNHGTIRALSIGFMPQKVKASQSGRIIEKAFVKEVSFTADPLEPLAVVDEWKSEVSSITSLSDFESFLRESGMYSKSMATALTSHLKTLILSDSGRAEEELQRKQAQDLQTVLNRYQLGIHQIIRRKTHV